MARDWSEYEIDEDAKPQTQLDRFVALYAEFGIELKPHKHEDGEQTITLGYVSDFDEDNPPSPKFSGGYSGFYSTVHFDADGNFIKQNFWE